MDRLKMQSLDVTGSNIDKIAQLFPQCVTEHKDKDGKTILGIDFEKLRDELSADVIDDGEERYQFTWPDKKAHAHLANTPTTKTLRPCREESVDFDHTQNLYIEGDNLDVLKVIRETYLGKVKMIYIDPPYNTGNDFVYNDNFSKDTNEYQENSGQLDEEGNRLVQNTESNGRFHTDWLNMIYPRLKVAKDLLTEDGVIFISIDDNEVENLRKVCDEIFGRRNFIAQVIIDGTPKNDPYVISTAHEYCIVYCRNFESIKDANYGVFNPIFAELEEIFSSGGDDYRKIETQLKEYYKTHNLSSDNISNYKFVDKHGIYRIGPIDDPQNSGYHDERINPKTGRKCATPNRGWSCTLSTWNEWIKKDLILFPDSDDKLPSKKTYIYADRLDVMRAYYKIQTRKDTDALKKLFGTSITPFSNPKPVLLLKQFIQNCNDKNMIVLDFFSGSGTFMHATFLQNLEDCGKRCCILVQLPELIEMKSSQSNKAKKIASTAIDFLRSIHKPFKITEIGKERIRRAGKKIKEEAGLQGQNLDIGFRVLKLDSSNMQDVYYTPKVFTERDLFADNVKPDRTAEDLLFQMMLDLGVELSATIEQRTIDGKQVFFVNDNYLVACFDENIAESTITEIAKMKPYYFVMRDSSLASDNVADNFDQLFETYSKDTIRKII